MEEVYLYLLMEVLQKGEGKNEKDGSREKANVRGGYHRIHTNAGGQFIPDSEKHLDIEWLLRKYDLTHRRQINDHGAHRYR